MKAKPPVVYVRRVTYDNGIDSFQFDCEFCHRVHSHGAMEGHRWAHCHNPESPFQDTGYILRERK